MSSNETQSVLSKAYELVEAGQYDDARAILDPILTQQPNNADAWWVYAHAVTTSEDGRKALENVLRIDPRYPGAAELLAQARELSPMTAKVTSVPPPPGTIPEAHHLDEDFSEPDDVQDDIYERPAQPTFTPSAERERSSMPIIAIVAVIAALLVVALLILPGLLTPSSSATPTQSGVVVAVPSDSAAVSTVDLTSEVAASGATEAVEPTRRPTITPTIEGATSEAVSVSYPEVSEALASFPVREGGLVETETSLGRTLLATVCSAPGREMRMLLPQVMNTLAMQTPGLDANLQAIGVSMVNCDTDTPMLAVASEMLSAQNYAQGDLSDAEFAASWRPQ